MQSQPEGEQDEKAEESKGQEVRLEGTEVQGQESCAEGVGQGQSRHGKAEEGAREAEAARKKSFSTEAEGGASGPRERRRADEAAGAFTYQPVRQNR